MAETYQVILTKAAKRDINDILDYLLDNVSLHEAADAREKILSAAKRLESIPHARSPVQEVVKQNAPIIFRQVIAKKVYRIIFRIEEVQKHVIIMRVIHVKRGTGFVKKALK
jgi:plasmid stabilization system protein ParE